jgi:dolichol-phosphate mannosyltransferase
MPPSMSIIVPTRNERGNVRRLFDRIDHATTGIPVEVIVVDDSSDGTADVARELGSGRAFGLTVIERPPERHDGLGKAVVEGIRAARHEWVCVIDGDLQHPPEVIPQLLDRALDTGVDLVAASRLRHGGGTEGLSFGRELVSRILAAGSRLLFARRLARLTDPLTGFFVVRRSALDPDRLQPEGFKILLEILVRTPGLQAAEIPFEFAERCDGTSKACSHEAVQLLRQVLRLGILGQRRMLAFLLIGATGIAVNTALMALCAEGLGLHYVAAAAVATQGSSIWNFVLIDCMLFRDRSDSGRAVWRRLAGFLALNNAMLALRAPVLTLLVAGLGLHYLVANVGSLLVMALARYGVSERWIWTAPRVHARAAAAHAAAVPPDGRVLT